MSIKNTIKENGVIYTPEWIVDHILDLCNYKLNIYDKKVLEPGCGEGAFLTKIVERIIIDARDNNINDQDLLMVLSQNVFGLDIDAQAIEKCKIKLNNICDKYNLSKCSWDNIKVATILSSKTIEDYTSNFDFIFGNPPYVRIQNLDKISREFIINNCKFCESGSTDLYIAFFELGFNFLNDKGILGYITPSSYLTSATGKELRGYLSSVNMVEILVDFEHHQVFEDATTYSLITIFNKQFNKETMKLYKGDTTSIRYDSRLSIKDLGKDHWVLEKSSILNKINLIKKRGTPLSKVARIHTGIATLKDELYIFNDPPITVCKDGKKIATITLKSGRKFDIEKSILKKIIKASTWKGEDQKLFIIFPYKKVNGKHVIIPESEMEDRFPLTLNYFKRVKHTLNERDKGDKAKLAKYPAWYAFGRSQSIDTSFEKKIITAGLNKKPNFIICDDENTTYYAGYSIHCDFDHKKIIERLNSKDMEYYINFTSKDYLGGYKSYSKASIKDFGIAK